MSQLVTPELLHVCWSLYFVSVWYVSVQTTMSVQTIMTQSTCWVTDPLPHHMTVQLVHMGAVHCAQNLMDHACNVMCRTYESVKMIHDHEHLT